MARHTVLVFLLLAIISVITSAKQVVQEGDLRDIVKMQNGMLNEYNINLDQIPLKEFRASLVALDGLAKNYNGKCRGDIYNATTIGYHATDNYFKATMKIFRWCSYTKKMITSILHNNSNKTIVFKAMMATTKQGLMLIPESIDFLEKVKGQLLSMHTILLPIPRNLTEEITQMRKDYDKQKSALAAIELAKTVIFGLVERPLGIDQGLAGALALAGIPAAVIEGHQIPTQDEKMIIIEAYYKIVIQVVQKASFNVTAVGEKLNVAITRLQTFYAHVKSATELGDLTEEFMKTDLQTLLKSVNEFLERHHNDTKLVLESH